MKRLLSLTAGALFAVLTITAATPSFADPTGDAIGAGVVGGMLGFMAGTAAADGDVHVHVHHGYGPPPPPPPPHWYWHHDWDGYGPRWGYGGDDWHDHVRACFETYGSDYDPRTNTYLDDDGYPHHCHL